MLAAQWRQPLRSGVMSRARTRSRAHRVNLIRPGPYMGGITSGAGERPKATMVLPVRIELTTSALPILSEVIVRKPKSALEHFPIG